MVSHQLDNFLWGIESEIIIRDNRRAEIEELTAQGKIPHEQELEKHPEKSMEGRMCMLMITSCIILICT